MKATDELRAMLDELGVEHTLGDGATMYDTPIGLHVRAFECVDGDGTLDVIVNYMTPAQAIEATLGRNDPPYDELIRLLAQDWGIVCSWDGLRYFWYIGLTEKGMRKRDERDVENAKLRERVRELEVEGSAAFYDAAYTNDENRRLRELVWDLYCLAYPNSVEWEASDAAYDKYRPCEKCHKLHGGKSPCASTANDMSEECCNPIQAAVIADRMRELGIEVDE